MRVLFVCSGNHAASIGTVVANQAQSIEAEGIEVAHFAIQGRGAAGYLRNVRALWRRLRQEQFDVVHAHYSLSGFVATLAGARPLVVSLMGSDAQVRGAARMAIRLLNRWAWRLTIVKSAGMARQLGLPDVPVIPNGVSLERFDGIDRDQARAAVGFEPGRRYVIFVSDPARPAKDFALAEAAFARVRAEGATLRVVAGVSHARIPVYMAAADVLLLTSRYEGSPNVIKEAMAACLPIVSTDVGDVRDVIGPTEGCHVVSGRDPAVVAAALSAALAFGRRTDGRERIRHFDARVTALEIIRHYERVSGAVRTGASPASS